MAPLSKICSLSLLLAVPYTAVAWPRSLGSLGQGLSLKELGLPPAKRADPSLTGYLGAFFLGDAPDVYFYLSDGNDATSFKALNGGNPVLQPTQGTGGVRDPAIVSGGGTDEGKKWYIIGTDLDISKTNWGASQRQGSLGILVWESTDLVTWTDERLVTVENSSAGMVWAPEAVWDESQGQYLVHWASKFYDDTDPEHAGNASTSQIRYAYTSDFKTFSEPQTYIDYTPVSIIDLNILPYPGDSNTLLRFIKDEGRTNVFLEYSTTGLFGEWTRPGGSAAFIREGVEGPGAYWDNSVDNLAHLLVDDYGGDGYFPVESSDPQSNSNWENSDRKNFPKGLRHGGVLPIQQAAYDALMTTFPPA